MEVEAEVVPSVEGDFEMEAKDMRHLAVVVVAEVVIAVEATFELACEAVPYKKP